VWAILRSKIAPRLGALQHRNFRLFYSALLVWAIGLEFQSIANVWQVYELTNSPLHLGLIGLARGLPIVVLSLVGGVVADRVNRLRFTIFTQALSSSLGLILAVLTATGLIRLWHIYAISMIGATISSLSSPARNAMIPSLVPRNQLLNALALNSSVWQISNIIAPALAGLSIAVAGLSTTYIANSAAHIMSLVALAGIRIVPSPTAPRQSALKSLIEGLRFVRRQSIILALLGMDGAFVFFGSYRALLPIFAGKLGLGAEGLGMLLSAPAVGALLGTAVILGLGDLRYKGLWITGAILLQCFSLVLLAVSPWFFLAVLATAVIGFCDSFQSAPRNTIIQSTTPDELRGRVASFQRTLSGGLPSLGQAQSGALASVIGVPLALIVGATICASATVAMVTARRDLRTANL